MKMQSPENMKNATDEQTRHDLELINQNAEQQCRNGRRFELSA
jgi:hypothetical protein